MWFAKRLRGVCVKHYYSNSEDRFTFCEIVFLTTLPEAF